MQRRDRVIGRKRERERERELAHTVQSTAAVCPEFRLITDVISETNDLTTSSFLIMLRILISISAIARIVRSDYPVPTPPGGRFDVHGWLVLPIEQPNPTNPRVGLDAWFSHHVPEFWTDSPHNFQIILRGRLEPMSCVDGELFTLIIPYPPAEELVVYEYSFTPPSPFSLNDLLNGDIKHIRGVYYNGSFDTPYQREPLSLATLVINELTTATYLFENETDAFQNLQYLSYPRGDVSSSHYYLAHHIKAQPDFDHVVHVKVSNCSDKDTKTAHTAGQWSFPTS